MAIYAENISTPSTPAPEGNHAARAVQMIDMGTQKNKFDPSKADQRKVRISFELPDELREDGKPFIVSQKFTLTMHEKGSLRKFLQSWRGKPFADDEAKRFNISVLLGKPCLLNIIHETKEAGKTFANIASVATLPKSMSAPAQITPTLEFSLSPDDFDQLVYESLPEFLKEEIAASPEYRALQAPAERLVPVSADEEEGLPS